MRTNFAGEHGNGRDAPIPELPACPRRALTRWVR